MFLFDPHPAHSATRGLAQAQKARWEPLAVIATLLIRRIPKRTLYSGCVDEGSIRQRHRGRNVARGGPVLPRWRAFGGVELEPGPAGLVLPVIPLWPCSRHGLEPPVTMPGRNLNPTFQRPRSGRVRNRHYYYYYNYRDRGYRQIAMVARFYADRK